MYSFLFMWAAWVFAMLATDYDSGVQVFIAGCWTGGVVILSLWAYDDWQQQKKSKK